MKRSILFIFLLIIFIVCSIILKGYLDKNISGNKTENKTNIALGYMEANLSEEPYKKLSESNLVSNSASKEILVRFNGILYGKSFGIIDYAGNTDKIIDKIDKVTNSEYIPKLNGETNSEELLDSEICEANINNIIIKYKNELVSFEKIIEYDNLNFVLNVKANSGMKKNIILDSSDASVFYYSLDNVTITLKENQVFDLKYALENSLITVNDIISKAEADAILNKINVDTFKDGGSRLYDYGTYIILKLNTLNGNRDMYIGIPEMDINSLNI